MPCTDATGPEPRTTGPLCSDGSTRLVDPRQPPLLGGAGLPETTGAGKQDSGQQDSG
jgi:hypothetical protein